MRLERGDIWRPPRRVVGYRIRDKDERILSVIPVGRVNIVGDILSHFFLKLLFKIASKRKLDSTRRCFIF